MKLPDPIKHGRCRKCFASLPEDLSGTNCPNCDQDPYIFSEDGYRREDIIAFIEFIKATKEGQHLFAKQAKGH